MMSEALLLDLQRRAAIKIFDPEQHLSHEQIEVILEAARLSPSSFGIQPRKIVVIEDPELRKELRKHSYDQTQITTCSHLLVLCGLDDISDSYIDTFVDTSLQQGGERDRLESYRTMLKQSMSTKRADGTLKRYISNQVYLMLGNILHTCARLRIDAAPMEGFSSEKYDDILGLDEQGCHVCVICALGYRSEEDTRSKRPKVRREQNQITIRHDAHAAAAHRELTEPKA